MENKKFPKQKKITLSLQRINLNKQFNNLIIKNNSKLWIDYDMKLSPTENSKGYHAKLIYKSLNKNPYLLIDLIDLNNSDNNKIPHNYGIEKINNKNYLKLCLWHRDEWNGTKFLSKTIVCWGIEWLMFYELWLITGKWLGGGIEHIKKKDLINS